MIEYKYLYIQNLLIIINKLINYKKSAKKCDKMSILLTNIKEDMLNQNIIKESFTKLKHHGKLKEEKIGEIKEVVYLKEKSEEVRKDEETEKAEEKELKLKHLKTNNFKVDMDKDIEEVYKNINQIIEDILKKKEFLNVIVDTSFLAYIILEILIKKFDITEVFILDNNELKKAHPCGCGEESIGIS